MWVVSYYIPYVWLLAYSNVVTVTSFVPLAFLPVVSDRSRRTCSTSSSTTCTVPTKHYAVAKSNKEEDIPNSGDNDEIIKEDNINSNNSDDDTDDVSLDGFQKARKRRDEQFQKEQDKIQEYDGYFLRDVIYAKWGFCYDVDFNRVDSFGTKLYLNVLPFHLGGRNKFRHETELDYLCHLQAVIEILEKYDQLDYVLSQIEETNKKPRAGTSPLVAVPLRLDLTREQVEEIIGY
ncbi:MAG: hypothetical protein ACI8RD_012679 [Bacillariaceae sp.]|jgi:hypothetical protein